MEEKAAEGNVAYFAEYATEELASKLMKYRDERVRAEAKVRDDSLGSTERRRPPSPSRREAVGGQI